MPSRALSNEDFEDWRVCWRVNSAFATEFDNQQAAKCIKCGADIPPDTLPYRSLFVSHAVESPCSHLRDGSLCSDCDVDMVFRISRGEETCFHNGCDEVLSVDKAVISTALSKLPKLLAEYAILLWPLRHRSFA
jgi:hypothetical protein